MKLWVWLKTIWSYLNAPLMFGSDAANDPMFDDRFEEEDTH